LESNGERIVLALEIKFKLVSGLDVVVSLGVLVGLNALLGAQVSAFYLLESVNNFGGQVAVGHL
jgi:hypothetical protein